MRGEPVTASAIGRVWGPDGFARTAISVTLGFDALEARLVPFGRDALILCAVLPATAHALPLRTRTARPLGEMLTEAGCLSLASDGQAPEDALRGTIANTDLAWWLRFSGAGAHQRVDLYAEGPAGHARLALWPIEAIGLGARLIRAGDDWAARAPQAEAA